MRRLALIALLLAPLPARADVDASIYGAVEGPIDHELTEPERAAVQAQFDRFVQAMRDLGAGRYEAAAATFEDVADTTGWFEAAYNASLSRRAQGRYRAALARTEQALKLRPDTTPALYLKAALLQGLGRHEDALAATRAGLQTAGGDALQEALGELNLGASLRLLGRPEQALASYRRARALAEQLGDATLLGAALAGEGYTHAVTGDSAAAQAAMSGARERGASTDLAEVELALAGLQLKAGDRAAADASLSRALASAASFDDEARRAGVLLQAANLQQELGLAGPASRSLAEADGLLKGTELDVLRASVLTTRGGWALEAGRLDDGRAQLGQAVALLARTQAPLALAEARLRLAQGALQQRDFAAATRETELARTGLANTGATELRRRAQVLDSEIRRRQGDLAGALDSLRAARKLASSAARPIRERLDAEIALLLATTGQVEEALGAEQALGQAELDADLRGRLGLQLGYALRDAERGAEAITHAQAARLAAIEASDAELVDAAIQLVIQVHLDAGRATEAEAWLQSIGEAEGALQRRVQADAAVDRYNDAVEAYNQDRFEAAAEGFAAVAADAAQPADRQQEARLNYTDSLLQLAQKRADRDEPSGAYVALKKAADTGTGPDAARAGLLAAEAASAGEDFAAAARYAEIAARHGEAAGVAELAGQGWMAVGDATFEVDPPLSAAAYQRALDAWGQSPKTLGPRAMATWNLGLLAWNADDEDGARARLGAALTLAREAGLTTEVREISAALAEMSP